MMPNELIESPSKMLCVYLKKVENMKQDQNLLPFLRYAFIIQVASLLIGTWSYLLDL